MGHDNPQTTYGYGHITRERQAEIIASLGQAKPDIAPDDAMAESIARKVTAMLEKTRP